VEQADALGVDAVVLGGDLLNVPAVGQCRVKGQRAFLDEVLAPILRRTRRPIYAIPGNDDLVGAIEPAFAALEAEGVLVPLHGRALPLGEGWTIAGYGCVPLTPFAYSDYDRVDVPGWRPSRPKTRVLASSPAGARNATDAELRARPTMEAELATLAEQAGDPARTVWVTHSPPHEVLDQMHGGARIGSRAVRALVERLQPPLTLHGHVHEAPVLLKRILERVGRTVCVNPGTSRLKLRAALVDPAAPGDVTLVH
jgi:Icc-related predicted phosphoesterase